MFLLFALIREEYITSERSKIDYDGTNLEYYRKENNFKNSRKKFSAWQLF